MHNTKRINPSYLLFSIFAIGFCMRPSLTGIGSLLQLIKPDMGLSDTTAGLLTTLPMLAFAAFSPAASVLNRKIGTSNTLFLGFGCIIAGILMRSWLGFWGLMAGTFLLGIGISFGNVLMPAIIKGEFPEKYGIVTAVNSSMLAISSGIASGINYPLASTGLGWRWVLCIWAGVALLGILTWIPVRSVSIVPKQEQQGKSLLRSGTAWAVTLFLGLVSLLFYSCTSWLSTIFQAKGLDAAMAGYYVSAFQMTGILSSFCTPALAGRRRDQRAVTWAVLGVFAAGIVLILWAPNAFVLLIGALLAGFACNGCFALSMIFIGFRAGNAADAAALSSMSQSVGYLIAAAGPLGMGFLFHRFGSWNGNLLLILAIIALLVLVTNRCARDETV